MITLPHSLDAELEEAKTLFKPASGLARFSYLCAADVILTDNSGIGFECAAIDKPMVLLGHPNDQDFFSDLVSKSGRSVDYGPVALKEDLVETVNATLARPDAHREARRYWAERVFGPLDGRSCERVLQAAVCGAMDRIENRLGSDDDGQFVLLSDLCRNFRFFRSHHHLCFGETIRITENPVENFDYFFRPVSDTEAWPVFF